MNRVKIVVESIFLAVITGTAMGFILALVASWV